MGVGEEIDGDGESRTGTMVPESWRLAERELLDSVVRVSREIERLEALRVKLVGEVDSRCHTETLGFRSTKLWLAARTLLEVPAAGRIVHLARGLRVEPEIAAAFEAGTISAEHAGLIVRFCERPPKGMPLDALGPCRELLLQAATGPTVTTDALRGCIAQLERIFESDDPPPSEDTDYNEFYASRTLNGRVSVKGNVDAETGEMLLAALSALSAPRPAEDGTPDPRTPARRRADAFTELLRRYLGAGLAPQESGERPHLNLHVNAKDLADLHGLLDRDENGHRDRRAAHRGRFTADRGAYEDLFGDTGVAWLPWMGPLTVSSARRLGCDCILATIILDEHGAPINLGRTVRTVSKKQRRALVARDRGCAFPHCGAPAAWCEGHHIRHWIDGGPTDLDNLVLLCGFHHRLLHHSDWEVVMGTDRHPWFIPPRSVDVARQPVPAYNRAGPRAA